MFDPDNKLETDYNKIVNKNIIDQINFDRYLYAYRLFKLQLQLSREGQNNNPNSYIPRIQNSNPIGFTPRIQNSNPNGFSSGLPTYTLNIQNGNQALTPYIPRIQDSNQNIQKIEISINADDLITQPTQPTQTQPTQTQTQQTKSNKIFELNTLNDSIDKSINNAAVIVQIPDKTIIIVKNSNDNLWMLPGGHIDRNESPLNCAIREFKEETSLTLDQSKIIFPIKYFDRKHANSKRTRIFKINTTQIFNPYNIRNIKNNETNALEYISIDDIKKQLLNSSYFNPYNRHTFTESFLNNFL